MSNVKFTFNNEKISIVQSGEIIIPQSEEGTTDENGILIATEIFKRIPVHNIMRALQQEDDRFMYVIVDFDVKEIEIRKKYILSVICDRDDLSKNEDFEIEAKTDEEGRMYRSIYKNKENALVALVDYRDDPNDEWTSELVLHYDKGPVARSVVDFVTRVVQIAFNHKRFTTFKEVETYVNDFLTKKGNELKTEKALKAYFEKYNKE